MTAERPWPLETSISTESTERILNNPPQLILVFDDWRGEGEEANILAQKTMSVRAGLAASIFHSTLYQSQTERPLIACFAGTHKSSDQQDPVGSQPSALKVSAALAEYNIPPGKIITRENTITTTTDLQQLCAFARAYDINNIAIVTTDDHVTRTKLEIRNHFANHSWQPNITIISPSSSVLNNLRYPKEVDINIRSSIDIAIGIGKRGELDHGWKEDVATVIAWIPIRCLRIPIQSCFENRTH